MKSFALSAIAAIATIAPTALAQTSSECNPLEKKGCPSMQALGSNATFDFVAKGIPTDGKVWRKENQGKIDWDQKEGATFIIERSKDSPRVQSNFYMLFGRLEVVMKAAKGQGIVSSAILQSEALDELDWEFLGTSNKAMTNYFGKGNTTDYTRGKDFEMSSPQDEFHNYTIDWRKEWTKWYLDGKELRTLTPGEALGGKNYPQTPMNVRLSVWAAGDKNNNDPGVIEWAKGETDFSKGPFTMSVQKVYAQDYTNAKEYSWDDMDASGSSDKVKIIAGGAEDPSEVLHEIQSPSGVRNRWAALPQGAKIGIIAGSLGVFALLLCVMAFCCVRQRRAGRKEHAALLADEQKEAAELQEYKLQMQGGKFAMSGGSYGRV